MARDGVNGSHKISGRVSVLCAEFVHIAELRTGWEKVGKEWRAFKLVSGEEETSSSSVKEMNNKEMDKNDF